MSNLIARDVDEKYLIETPDYVSEIFPLKFANGTIYCFELQPNVGKKSVILWRGD